MAKLYFRYGAMSAGKTASILQIAKNYEDCNKTALIVKPDIDTRSGDPHVIKSRIGISGPCITISELPNYLYNMCDKFKEYVCNIDPLYKDVKIEMSDLVACILVDEAQFLEEEQVNYLANIVDQHNVPVICYGVNYPSLSHSVTEVGAS